MKQLLLIGIILCCTRAGAQQQVSLSEIRAGAVSALKAKTGLTAINEQAIDTVFSLKNKSDQTLLYECKFQDGKTVLMSGSKACFPVLGYFDSESSESILDPDADIPDGLRDLLREYQEQIELCFSIDTIQLYHQEEWTCLYEQSSIVVARGSLAANYIIVQPLITSKWNQSVSNDGWDCPAYNYSRPIYGGGRYVVSEDGYTSPACSTCVGNRCPAGCVAVAMAQIINYWKYPSRSPITVEYYDWCNMVDLYATSPNYIKERVAVSDLIRDCGVKAQMNYCDGGCQSSATSKNARTAFVNDFNYSCSSYKKKSKTSNWTSKIKANLDAGRPVYYDGRHSDPDGGHAFICDGYGNDGSNDYFHFNWGWGGWPYDDGWFLLNNLNPSSTYNSKQGAIFDIAPPSGYEEFCDYTMSLSDHYNDLYSRISPSQRGAEPYRKVPNVFQNLESASLSDSASWRTIPSGATSEYVAHNRVVLKPGFRAEAGSHFTARIEPCSGNCNNTATLSLMANDESFLDEDVVSSRIVEETITTETTEFTPRTAQLYQNHPNPFTGETTIGYYLPEESGEAWIRITNTSGIVVKTINITAYGEGEVSFNAGSLNPGVYFYSLLINNGQVVDTKRMVVK